MIKLEILITFIGLGLTIYSLIDCAKTPQESVRNLPKWGWILIILFIGTLGPIAWLTAGRPKGNRPPRRRPGRDLPPDDNPDFLKNL